MLLCHGWALQQHPRGRKKLARKSGEIPSRVSTEEEAPLPLTPVEDSDEDERRSKRPWRTGLKCATGKTVGRGRAVKRIRERVVRRAKGLWARATLRTLRAKGRERAAFVCASLSLSHSLSTRALQKSLLSEKTQVRRRDALRGASAVAAAARARRGGVGCQRTARDLVGGAAADGGAIKKNRVKTCSPLKKKKNGAHVGRYVSRSPREMNTRLVFFWGKKTRTRQAGFVWAAISQAARVVRTARGALRVHGGARRPRTRQATRRVRRVGFCPFGMVRGVLRSAEEFKEREREREKRKRDEDLYPRASRPLPFHRFGAGDLVAISSSRSALETARYEGTVLERTSRYVSRRRPHTQRALSRPFLGPSGTTETSHALATVYVCVPEDFFSTRPTFFLSKTNGTVKTGGRCARFGEPRGCRRPTAVSIEQYST